MACRNGEKMKKAADDIKGEVPTAIIHELTVELGNMVKTNEKK